MPFYDHLCKACQYEWEDFYSMVTDPPDTCPKCKVKGEIIRPISAPAVRVPKTGMELRQEIAEDRKKIRAQSKKDENFKANLKGESAYHQEQIAIGKINNDLKQI